MDWKKIIKWVLIILVILFIIGILSEKKDSDLDLTEAEDIVGSIDTEESPDDNYDSSEETPSIEEKQDNSKVNIGLTEDDIVQLEEELNALQIEDLGGLSE